MSQPPAKTGPRKAAVLFILVTVLLDMLSFGIIIPVLPKLVEEFFFGHTAQAAVLYGLMGTAWALAQFFSSPIQGALSDRFGRRPVVLLSNLGLGLDYIVMALAPNVGWLVAGRVISGMASSSFSTAGAYIADVTPPEQRAAAFGKIGMVFGLGFIFGPALGGWLGAIDPRLPFWGAASLSLMNACYGFFVLPESLSRDKRMPSRGPGPTRSVRSGCCAHTMSSSASRQLHSLAISPIPSFRACRSCTWAIAMGGERQASD